MTPSARLAAAIEVLDRVLAGRPAEQALTNWARASRFAGSGDRAAVRDLVFDALRCRRSFAALGGAETGRGLILGGLRAAGVPPESLFTGEGHAPSPLSPDEALVRAVPDGLVALDCPDWLAPVLRDGLGDQFEPVMQALRHRAPVFLRANLGQVSRDEARAALSAEGIVTQPHPLANSALEVTENARKIQSSQAFANGFVELQDASSQAVVELLPLRNGMRVLDYCAGGGGKTLAMAARAHLTIFAHDANPARMRDLPARAARAGCPVQVLKTAEVAQSGPFDLVLADVPCSGSGSWRRAPEAKWTLTADGLAKLTALQAEILGRTAALVGPNGTLAYVTCSMIAAENGRQVAAFLAARPDWQMELETGFSPLSGGDGFYLALLARRRTAVSA